MQMAIGELYQMLSSKMPGALKSASDAASESTEKISEESGSGFDELKKQLEEIGDNLGKLGEKFKGDKIAESLKKISTTMADVSASISAASGDVANFNGILRELGVTMQPAFGRTAEEVKKMEESFTQAMTAMMQQAPQSQLLAEHLTALGNPLRTADRLLLGVTASVERFAKTPVQLAFEQNPNATFEQVATAVQNINAGLERMKAVATASWGVFKKMGKSLFETATKVNKDLNPALKEFKEAWGSQMKPAAEAFGVIAVKVLEVGTEIGNFFKKLSENNPTLSAMIGLFGILAVGLTALLSPLAIGVGGTGGLAVAFGMLWTTIGPLVTGLAAVAGTAVIIAGALVALGAVLYKLWTNSEAFRTSVTGLFEQLLAAVMTAVEPIKAAWEELVAAFMSVVSQFTGNQGTMTDFWTLLGDTIAQVVDKFANTLVPVFQAAMTILAELITVVLGTIKMLWQAFGDEILVIVTAFWNMMMGITSGVLEVLRGIIDVFIGLFTGDWERLGQGLLTIWNGIWTALGAVLVGVWDIFSSYLRIILEGLILWFTELNAPIKEVWQALWDMVVGVLSGTWERLKGTFDVLMGLFTGDWERFTKGLLGIWNGLWDSVGAVLLGLWDLWGAALSVIASAFGGWFEDLAKQSHDWGRNVIQGLINGIKSMMSSAISLISDFASDLAASAKSMLGIHSPSRVFMEIGGYISEGMGLGIHKKGDAARNSLANLVSEMTASIGLNPSAAVPALSMGGGVMQSQSSVYNNEYVFHVSIPAKDLEEMRHVQDFFGRINRVANAMGVR